MRGLSGLVRSCQAAAWRRFGVRSTQKDPEEPTDKTDKTDKPPGRPGEFEFRGLPIDLPGMRAEFCFSPGSGKRLSVLSVLSVGSSGSFWALDPPKRTYHAT